MDGKTFGIIVAVGLLAGVLGAGAVLATQAAVQGSMMGSGGMMGMGGSMDAMRADMDRMHQDCLRHMDEMRAAHQGSATTR